MDLFETLGLGPRQPEENELYVAIYADPDPDADLGLQADVDAGATGASAGRGASAAGVKEIEAGDASAGGSVTRARTEAERLEALRSRCTAWLLPYTSDYVWNKDPLVLRSSAAAAPPWERRRAGGGAGGRRRAAAAAAAAAAAPAEAPGGAAGGGTAAPAEGCVWAVMRFGDAVDDEWWAVWLLLRMTRELQDLSVQVWDNDGQFLLIEAAYALPRWLKPELAANRVWLRRGRLHVLPLPSAAAPDLPPSPTHAQALAVLREGRYATASPRVQRPIDERLAGYPERARTSQQHVARCTLPGPLAAALRVEPQLVAELVEAFYYRDADDMRAASRMRVLPPSLDRVPTLVRMTRCHYAQLAQQRFAPPRGMPMPPPDSPLAKAADLGLKLTVAAEILCARYPDAGKAAAAAPPAEGAAGEAEGSGGAEAVATGAQSGVAAATAAGLAADPAWQRFKASLESNGYFQGNIPGSRRYKELLAAAVEAFSAGLLGGASADDGSAVTDPSGAQRQRQDPRRRLAALVREAAAAGLRPEDAPGSVGQPTAEDDDSWLDQQPERLQAELERRQAESQEHASSRSAREHAASSSRGSDTGLPQQEVDADQIASQLRGFMEQLSGLEGVDTPGPAQGHASGGTGSGGDAIDFDPSSFLRELQKVLGKAGGDMKRRAGGGDAADQGGGNWDEDEGSTSGSEGSSFFSDDEDDDDGSSASGEEQEEQEEGEREQRNAHAGSKGGRSEPSTSGPPPPRQPAPALVAPRAAPSVARGAAAAGVITAKAGTSASSPPKQLALKRGFLSGNNGGQQAAQEHGKPKAARPSRPARDGVGIASAPDAAIAGPSGRTGGITGAGSQATAGSAARGAGTGVGASAVDAASLARKNVRWEVSTATDSDDDEDGSGSGGESEGEGLSDEGEEATARLMAALGVEDGDAEGSGAHAGQGGVAGGREKARSAGARSAGVPPTDRPRGTGSATARGEGFLQLYDAAMQAELASTTLTRSFESAAAPPVSGPAPTRAGGAQGTSTATDAGQEPQGEGALQPVDLDMNLVRNLLRSYTAQQGTAGPAGNMAGMLGLSLVAGDVQD